MVIFLLIVIFLLLVLLVGHGMVIRKLHRDLSYREMNLAVYRVWVGDLLRESRGEAAK